MDKRITAYGIGELVKIINRVPYEEMWKIYAMSDYFVNMNLYEIFGMSIMEAMCYETSVAAYSPPGPETTMKGMEGHCLYRDDREIENWLTGKYPSGKSLEESSRKVIQNLNWDRCADTFIGIVRQEAKEKP